MKTANASLKQSVLLFLFYFIACTSNVNAQNFDSKGTDFWIAFPPNYHNDGIGASDSLYIYIVAEEPTSGEIRYSDVNGKSYVKSFVISDISNIYTFGIQSRYFELKGFNDNGFILDNNDKTSQNEVIAPQSFHITSQKDIGVYALEQAITTSEAFLALPTDVLGKEYFVVAYNSDGRSGGINSIDGSSTPSQFVIVASEDNTEITITPKVPTRRYGSMQQQITLKKGDVYLVQAEISLKAGLQNDLTGSFVQSTKPIAVFGGQQRTKLPVEESKLSSRDCIIEQIPPLSTWGKSYLLTPYPQPPSITALGSDIYRVLAAQDNTDIFINGVKLTTLQRGGVYQGNLTTAGEITGSKPILVAQFKKTSTETSAGNSTQYSDPFMMILPPTEQFLRFYRFISAEAYDDDNPGGVYKNYEYATLIVPNSAKTSVKFDGKQTSQNSFSPIGSSRFSYIFIKTTVGTHTVECDSAIGLLVYGYGKANSYGYVGGMSYRQINKKMPDLILSNDCFSRKIIAPGVYDGGNRIASIVLDSNILVENLNISLPLLPPTRDSAHFSIALQDKYKDGSCGIVLTDTLGFQGKTKIDVCGFTIGITDAKNNNPGYLSDYFLIQKKLTTGRTTCIDVDLVNYGKCNILINEIKVLSGGKSIIDPSSIPSGPLTLKGNSRKPLRLCLTALDDGNYTDTLSIITSCGSRNALALDIQSQTDKNPPNITKTGDSCLTSFDIQVSDSLAFDSGLEFAEVVDSTNCSVQLIKSGSGSRLYKIYVKDPYQDAFFAVNARDSAGNSAIIRDTIPGFTLQFHSTSSNDPNPTIDYGVAAAGIFACDSLEIYNYGSYPLSLENIPLDVNIVFSIPPTQLPFLVQPGQTRRLAVCYSPVIARKLNYYDSVGTPDIDGFNINFRCLSKRFMLKGTPSDIYREGESRCNLPVNTIANSVAPHYYLDQGYPNPAYGLVRFSFDVPKESSINIVLTDFSGSELFTIVEGRFPAGRYVGSIPTDNLAPGLYFCRMTAGGELWARPLIVQ